MITYPPIGIYLFLLNTFFVLKIVKEKCNPKPAFIRVSPKEEGVFPLPE